MKILITGGAGFIGSALSRRLVQEGHEVVCLDLYSSRVNGVTSHEVNLTQKLDPKLFENIHGIIHLAGRSIFGKWDDEYKQSIYNSRIISTQNIYKAVEQLEESPIFFLSASAIGIYGDRGEELLDESSSIGSSFLAKVVQDWEAEVRNFSQLGLRTLSLRHGHVLGQRGLLGVLKPYYKWGIGGPIGKGDYYLSWIELNDLLDLYLYAIDHEVSGVVNAVSATPILYKDFSKKIAESLNRPHLFRIPKFVLSFLYSEEFTKEITSSQRVVTVSPWVKETVQNHDLAKVFRDVL